MELPDGIRRLFRLGSIRRDVRSELDDELAFHFEESVRGLVAHGLSQEEAREEARRRFGNEAAYRRALETIDGRRARSEEGVEMMERITSSVGFALRSIRRSPGFAAAIVGILGLGIGANAVMFGVVDRLLLSPPQHVRDADAVRHVYVEREIFNGRRTTGRTITYPDYLDLLNVEGFSDVAAYTSERAMTLGTGEDAERIEVASASPSLFPLLGVVPERGRFFRAEDDAFGADPVVVLAHEFWERRFGSDPDILGRTLDLGAGAFEVVGVAPAGFTGAELAPVDAWLPIARLQELDTGDTGWLDGPYSRNWWWLRAVVRLASVDEAVASEQATAAHLAGRERQISEDDYDEKARIVLASVIAARGPTPSAEARVARWLAGVSFIVLLIACFNVANLLLARAARWQRELAVRMALGVGRGRLLGQLLTESFLLSGLGAVAALLVARWGGSVIHQILLPDVAFTDAGLRPRLFVFIGVTTLLTAVLAGFLPALQATRSEVADALRGGRGMGRGASRTRVGLLVAQASLSVILLIGAGLFVRSLTGARATDLGFDAERLLVVRPEWSGEPTPDVRQQVLRDARERLLALPGVSGAALSYSIPFYTSFGLGQVRVPGIDSIPRHPEGGPYANKVGPGFFETMGLSIVQGRAIGPDDDGDAAPPVVVITESMAEAIWPDGSPLGQCMLWEAEDGVEPACTTVVGVVEDFRRQELVEASPHFQYMLNQSHYAFDGPSQAIMVRATGSPWDVTESIRRAVGSSSPLIRFPVVEPMMEHIEPQMRSWTLGASMFSLFGVLALVVAGLGLYSVLAFDVALRQTELGIRAALGAASSTLVTMVLRRALLLVGAGVVVGTAITLAGGRLIEPLLYEVSPRDPVVYGTVAMVLLLVAALAGWLPARRVARVDPRTALQAE